MELSERVFLVTGAARRVGRAIALALGARGAHVVVHYGRSEEAALRTSDELREMGVEALATSADLAEAAQVETLFERVDDRFGRLDGLVNSAATFQRRALDDITLEDWAHVMAVNLRAPFLTTRLAAARIRRSQRPDGAPGVIVNIGDLSGRYAWRDYAHHAVSKAGLLHFTRVAARELAPVVRVNAVVPGPVLPPPGQSQDDEAWHETAARLPLARTGHPADIGRAVVFLAEMDFMTGTSVTVDGGEHLLGPLGH